MRSERRRIWNGLLFAVLVTVLIFVSVGCAADTYTVCPDGGCRVVCRTANILNSMKDVYSTNYTFEVENATVVWSYENVGAEVDFDFDSNYDSNGDGIRDIVGSITTASNISILSLSGSNGAIIWNKSMEVGIMDYPRVHSLQSDVTGDGITEMLVEDFNEIVVLDGRNGAEVWNQSFDRELTIFGYVYAWEDFDGDGINDIIVVTTDWIEFKLGKIYLVKGDCGCILWNRTFNGWLGHPSNQRDFNADGVCDLVIEMDNLVTNSLIMLNGIDGSLLWSRLHNGSININFLEEEDFNKDGYSDIIAVSMNNTQNKGGLFILNGNDGTPIWNNWYELPLSIDTINDINDDGTIDIVVDNYEIFALSGVDGSQIWNTSLTGEVYTIPDINGDDREDVVVVNSTVVNSTACDTTYLYTVTTLSGLNGYEIWNKSLLHCARINISELAWAWTNSYYSYDLSGDGFNEVILRLTFQSDYPEMYSEDKIVFISGKDGSELFSLKSTLDQNNWVFPWAFVGDLNHDGVNDVLVTTYRGIYAIAYEAIGPVIFNVAVKDITLTSATVTWETDAVADSLVKYGTESGTYTLQAYDPANLTAHNLDLVGLLADTTYYFVANSTGVDGNSSQSGEYTFSTAGRAEYFDTGKGTYPSILGTHYGTIEPSSDMMVTTLYTYACPGTGGHSKSIYLYENGAVVASGVWSGYGSDWHNITLTSPITLQAGHTYNYTIVTGSYPQIIHESPYNATGGVITCEEFVDSNGKQHEGWIPAIRLS